MSTPSSGFSYERTDGNAEHYQQVCPRCRRAMFGLAQGALWAGKAETEINHE